ncbi:MAG: 4Fe-4S dicluster domain-containing protein [Paracoccaceae bacterium]|nr:4Fe-4S dicluster domain-containing protein [Paracoccaceae bacterium]
MERAAALDDPRPVLSALIEAGYRVIAPVEQDGAIRYLPAVDPDSLPKGRIDSQTPGSYRLEDGDPERWFDYVVSPESWKAWLYPARRKMWTSTRSEDGLSFERPEAEWTPTAFFGVRPCDLAAIEKQDAILKDGAFADPDYAHRRENALIVVIQCARSAETCFCASMNTGPRAQAGFDIALTELGAEADHRFLVEAGSEAGARVLEGLTEDATEADKDAAHAATNAAAASQIRVMPENVAAGLKARLTAPEWDDVAKRCLNCANCTMACPTCFCSDVQDTSDLTGDLTDRWRVWDSCFNPDFSYIHGGAVRTSSMSRYRQWMTHKLSSWHDQFGASGCVGCGRCIAWCPVGIDIVAEAETLMAQPED